MENKITPIGAIENDGAPRNQNMARASGGRHGGENEFFLSREERRTGRLSSTRPTHGVSERLAIQAQTKGATRPQGARGREASDA